MNELIKQIAREVGEAGGRALLVGGYVRDKFLGLEPKDMDVEVYNLESKKLSSILWKHGTVHTVGASFGVTKLHTPDGEWYDFSLPRRESKQGKGHRGFMVEPDSSMTVEEAASRRDFTINSMAMDPLTSELIDSYEGYEDLHVHVLRPTSEAFKEDPLRVLRGMQFAARFDMGPSSNLICMGREMFHEYKDLAVERVWGEWEKLCVKGKKISCGLYLLAQTGWLNHYPELVAMKGVQQDPVWHPEGDAWVHTLHVADAAVAIADRDGLNDRDRTVLVLAAICHDLGKPATTVFERDHWRAPGHDEAGVEPTKSFLQRIGCPLLIIDEVVQLVRWHMVHITNTVSKRLARKLSLGIRPSSIAMLLRVIEADMNGRPPLPGGLPPRAVELAELAASLDIVDNAIKPILMGRDLLKAGLTPGVEFGRILKDAFDAQVNGDFDDIEGAKIWLKNNKGVG